MLIAAGTLHLDYYSTVTRAHNIPLIVFENYFGLSTSHNPFLLLVVHTITLWPKRSSEQSKARKLPVVNIKLRRI